MINPAEIEEILALAEQILGIEQQNAAAQTSQLTYQNVLLALDKLAYIVQEIDHATYGLAAIQSQLATFQATTAVDVTAILTALGSPAQAGTPVTIDAPSVTAVTADVWAADGLFQTWSTRGQLLDFLGGYLYRAQWGSGVPLFGDDYFIASPSTMPPASSLNTAQIPTAEPINILPGDDLITWLTRENPGWTIGLGTDNTHYVLQYGVSPDYFFNCILDGEWFLRLQAANLGSAVAAAPVWPGVASVTFGTPVPFTGDCTVTGPLDGVEVVISSVPSKQGQFDFDGDISYRNIGGITFQSDDGSDEYPQLLGFAAAVYCPKSMAHAASAKLRVSPGVTGTVTPWSVS